MLVYIVLVFISYWLYSSAPSSMDRGFMGGCLTLTAFSLFWFFFHTKGTRYNLKRIHLRHSVLFLFAFSVVFFQNDLDYFFGLLDGTEKQIWYDTAAVSRALALSNVALNSLMLGFNLIKYYERKISQTKHDYSFRYKKELCYLGYFLLLVYLITVPREYLAGGYAVDADSGWSNVIIVLMQALFIAMFTIYSYEAKFNKGIVKIKDFYLPFSLTLLYILVVLVTGRRTEAVRMGILLVLVYIYIKGGKTDYKRIFVLGICAMLIISIVGIMRTGKDNLNESFDTIVSNSSVSPATKELAGSVNTLHVAVSNFPSEIGYTKGITFFPNYFVLIPGLDRFYKNNIRGKGIVTSSADMLTVLGLGNNATYGMGSSVVADVYISFGPVGVVVIFFIFGSFLRYLEIGTFAIKKSPYFLALSFCCYSQFVFVCRGTFANLFLSLSYAIIILLFCCSKNAKKVKNV